MADELEHRGPDEEGFFCEGPAALGSQRLAIIDLDTGTQPISSESGDIVVVQNGEIYNYLELREQLEAGGHRFSTHSDTEVIAHLYEEAGRDFVRKLRGMFAIAVWDRGRGRLVLARDRLGIKPLLYGWRGGAGSRGARTVFCAHVRRWRPDGRCRREATAAGVVRGSGRRAAGDFPLLG